MNVMQYDINIYEVRCDECALTYMWSILFFLEIHIEIIKTFIFILKSSSLSELFVNQSHFKVSWLL